MTDAIPQALRTEIKVALNNAREENGERLTVARKVQILETIKKNGWYYDRENVTQIPINPDPNAIIVDVDPIAGFRTAFTNNNTYKIQYFHPEENTLKQINVTNKAVEAGKSFEVEGIIPIALFNRVN